MKAIPSSSSPTLGRGVGDRRVELSVVVPVYDCAGTLQLLHERLTAVLSTAVSTYEIVFIDDRGHDCSWQIMKELAARDPAVLACRLSRNFGQQLAITAGLEQCSGNYAVVMDCDLQDPPEFIPRLLAEAEKGNDIVFARRKSQHQSALRALANRFYFRVLSAIEGRSFDGEVGSFSIISRDVIDAFLLFEERDRHYLMILNWLGFDSNVIDYERHVRRSGDSSYTFSKLISHALSGVFFSTTRMLHWVIYAGLGLAGSGALLALWFIIRWFIAGASPGWTSLFVVQLVVGGVITLCVGIAALYVGKIFEAAQRRPLYIVQERLDGRVLARSTLTKPESYGS